MNIEIMITVGLVFAAATAARIIYERQMDVLHGPYIEGRNKRSGARSLFDPLRLIAERLKWKLRGMIYLASIAA